MGVHSFCPAAVVAAPVETVWELLSVPALRDEWWEAHTARVVPEGYAAPGQVVYLERRRFGRTWHRTVRIDAVRPEKHQIQFTVGLLGGVNNQTTTVTAIDAESCRVQFG